MDIKNLKKIMPILQAIVDGKTIQHKTINREWYDTNVASLAHLVTYYKDYRIKPEPKYRPFKDAEECWNEMQKHQPIGYTKLIGEIEYSFITDVNDSINYSDAIKEYTFADGTPFGIREE